MGFILQKENLTDDDFYQISLLDNLFYGEKYLLKPEDYKERYNINNNVLYVIKGNQNIIVGYFSIIPLTYEAYTRIKKGEIDKEVINESNIISSNEDGEYFYWDSILIHPKFRRYGLGKKIVSFGINDIIKNNPKIKRILGHAISKGGVNISKKYGLVYKKNIDSNTVLLERAFQKNVSKKKKYKTENKIEKEKKRNPKGYYLNLVK